jgi:hypothetical protein
MGGAFLIIRDWTGTVQTVLSEEVQLKIEIFKTGIIDFIGDVKMCLTSH